MIRDTSLRGNQSTWSPGRAHEQHAGPPHVPNLRCSDPVIVLPPNRFVAQTISALRPRGPRRACEKHPRLESLSGAYSQRPAARRFGPAAGTREVAFGCAGLPCADSKREDKRRKLTGRARGRRGPDLIEVSRCWPRSPYAPRIE